MRKAGPGQRLTADSRRGRPETPEEAIRLCSPSGKERHRKPERVGKQPNGATRGTSRASLDLAERSNGEPTARLFDELDLRPPSSLASEAKSPRVERRRQSPKLS